MEPLEKTDNEAPVKIAMRWGGSDGKEYLFRCDLPWFSDADAFAQVFQSMMEAYGFSPRTITQYVESSLMPDDWPDEIPRAKEYKEDEEDSEDDDGSSQER